MSDGMQNGNQSTENKALELLHATMLMQGTAITEIASSEMQMFGKTFEDLLLEGYNPSERVALRDKKGVVWTAWGKSS